MQHFRTSLQPAAEQVVYCHVVVHQNLLKVIIGKSGLLQGIFLGPVAAVLRSLEGVVDVSILMKLFLD
jgi:hypothetical protein